jgi:pyroglutamyl-peptidase
MDRVRRIAVALVVMALAASAWADDDKGKILITGFEPFQGPTNPSWQAVKGMDGRLVNGYRVVAVELPVEWKRGAYFLERAIRDNRPVALISFGEGTPGTFLLEEAAQNGVNPNLTDNVNERYTKPKIRSGGPDEIRSTLPLSEIEAVVRRILPENLDVRRSQDPGGYLCEFVMYLGSYFMAKYQLDGPRGFIHVPYAGTSRTDFAIDQQVVAATVQALADHLDRRDQPPPPTEPGAPTSTPGFGGPLSSVGAVTSATR